MDATIRVDRLHRVMAARGWRFISSSPSLATFADDSGRTALVRLVQGDPERAVAADLLPYVRSVRLAAAAGGGGQDLVTAMVDEGDDGGVAVMAPPARGLVADGTAPQTAKRPARPVLRLTIEPGSATTAQVGAFLDAVSELNRALGGAGLEFQRLDGSAGDRGVRRG